MRFDIARASGGTGDESDRTMPSPIPERLVRCSARLASADIVQRLTLATPKHLTCVLPSGHSGRHLQPVQQAGSDTCYLAWNEAGHVHAVPVAAAAEPAPIRPDTDSRTVKRGRKPGAPLGRPRWD